MYPGERGGVPVESVVHALGSGTCMYCGGGRHAFMGGMHVSDVSSFGAP